MNLIPHSKPCMDDKEKKALLKVLQSNQIAQGPTVNEFEEKFAHFFGMDRGVSTSSGTSALHLALLALGIKEKDEIIIPSYVCTSLLNAVHYVRAVPKIVDIDPHHFNIDPASVRKNLTYKTKAVIVVHLFGFPADMNPLLKLRFPIIEDCAQATGARYDGKLTGTIGNLSIFSFYATKMMTTGEGGMILAKSRELIKKIRDIRDYDCKKDYKLRFNYKITDLQAAMGIVQLEKLPGFIRRRMEIKNRYDQAFSQWGLTGGLTDPKHKPVYYRYILLLKKGLQRFEKQLQAQGIICCKPIEKPLHRYLNLNPKNYPGTEEVFKNAVSIPFYPALTSAEVEKIATAVNNAIRNNRCFSV